MVTLNNVSWKKKRKANRGSSVETSETMKNIIIRKQKYFGHIKRKIYVLTVIFKGKVSSRRERKRMMTVHNFSVPESSWKAGVCNISLVNSTATGTMAIPAQTGNSALVSSDQETNEIHCNLPQREDGWIWLLFHLYAIPYFLTIESFSNCLWYSWIMPTGQVAQGNEGSHTSCSY